MAFSPLRTTSNILSRALRVLRAEFSTPRETDNSFLVGTRSLVESDRDRYTYNRADTLALALEAWRENPLARRIVGLTSQYVVGGGLSVCCKSASAAAFLSAFWNHRLNNLPIKTYEWCDELTRSGNLFILLTTDSAGMSYARAVPAANIERIDHQPNDIEQPTFYHLKASLSDPNPQPIPAYDPQNDPLPAHLSPAPPLEGRGNQGDWGEVMLHYAINRPVGAQWGESDLAPILKWLSRYSNWLEDRARLNRFRTAFLYVVKGRFASEADRIRRQQFLNTNPPSPGSILVSDESEAWEVISPRLESREAGEDGLSLKKFICSGAGIPTHFLSEPEGSTRTTAEAAGGPTFRHFEQRQNLYVWALSNLCQAALNRKASIDRRISAKADFEITGSDISSRDNAALALAVSNIFPVFASLRDRQLIDDSELMRILYKFAGETVDIEELLAEAKSAAITSAPLPLPPQPLPLTPPLKGRGGVEGGDEGDHNEMISNL